jgi:IS5 family transposase
MYLEDLGPKGPDAPTGGGVRVDGRRQASRPAFVRADDAEAALVRHPAAGFLQQACARLAERIRVSAGVTAGDATSEQRAVTRTPWLGLLLWFCACAGLSVSLIMRPDDPERGHRVVARNAAQAPIAGHPYPAPTLTEQAREVSLIASPRLPPRWAPD